jgi:heme exporter protein C
MNYIRPYLLNKYHRQILAVLFFLLFFFLSASVVSIGDAHHDYLQGIYSKILYIHVPIAWLSLGIYTTLALSGLLYVVLRNPLYDSLSQAIAPIGAIYALITLFTGSIWGKPTWGTWWVWDARLTSMLILFFTYLGYIGIRQSLNSSPSKAALSSSIFAVVGLVNIPIIKFSVYLWNSLHQQSTFLRVGGPSIHPSMLEPLFYTLPLFVCSALVAFVLRFNSILLEKRINRLKISHLNENKRNNNPYFANTI